MAKRFRIAVNPYEDNPQSFSVSGVDRYHSSDQVMTPEVKALMNGETSIVVTGTYKKGIGLVIDYGKSD